MSSARQKFTRFMLVTVSGLGLFSTAMLLSDPPPPAELENTPAIFSMNTKMIKAARSLASVETENQPSLETLLNLNCSEANQTAETSSARFRLKGDNCIQESSHPLSTQVRNKTNGYVATVFHRTPLSFTTDYINLKEGANEIAVKFETEKGTVEKTLTIMRKPASASVNN